MPVKLCDLFEENKEELNPVETTTINSAHFRKPLRQAREISVKTFRHKEAGYIAKQNQGRRQLCNFQNNRIITGMA